MFSLNSRRRLPIILAANKGIMLLSLMIVTAKAILLLVLDTINPTTFLPQADSHEYISLATSLVESGSFSRDGEIEIFRTPGYPVYLSMFRYLFEDNMITPVLFSQILVNLATAIFTYRLTALMFHNKRLSMISYFIVLVEPNMLRYQYVILSETVFTCLMVMGFYYLVDFVMSKKIVLVIAATLLFGMSVYVRPIAIYWVYIILITGLLYMLYIKRHRHVVACLAALVIYIGMIQAWEMRNHDAHGIKMFSTLPVDYAYNWLASSIVAKAENRPWWEVKREFVDELEPLSMRERIDYASKRSREVILGNIKEGILIWTKGMLTNMFEPGTQRWLYMLKVREPTGGVVFRKYQDMGFGDFVLYLIDHEKRLMTVIGIGVVWTLVLWVTMLIGVRYNYGQITTIMILMTIAYFLVVSSGPGTLARFRVPITPLIAVYSAYGMSQIFSWRVRRGKR